MTSVVLSDDEEQELRRSSCPCPACGAAVRAGTIDVDIPKATNLTLRRKFVGFKCKACGRIFANDVQRRHNSRVYHGS